MANQRRVAEKDELDRRIEQIIDTRLVRRLNVALDRLIERMGAVMETRQKVDPRRDRVPNSTANLEEIEYDSNSEGDATLFFEEDPSDGAFFVAGGDGEPEFDEEEEIVTRDGVPNLMCEKEDMESESSRREELGEKDEWYSFVDSKGSGKQIGWAKNVNWKQEAVATNTGDGKDHEMPNAKPVAVVEGVISDVDKMFGVVSCRRRRKRKAPDISDLDKKKYEIHISRRPKRLKAKGIKADTCVPFRGLAYCFRSIHFGIFLKHHPVPSPRVNNLTDEQIGSDDDVEPSSDRTSLPSNTKPVVDASGGRLVLHLPLRTLKSNGRSAPSRHGVNTHGIRKRRSSFKTVRARNPSLMDLDKNNGALASDIVSAKKNGFPFSSIVSDQGDSLDDDDSRTNSLHSWKNDAAEEVTNRFSCVRCVILQYRSRVNYMREWLLIRPIKVLASLSRFRYIKVHSAIEGITSPCRHQNKVFILCSLEIYGLLSELWFSVHDEHYQSMIPLAQVPKDPSDDQDSYNHRAKALLTCARNIKPQPMHPLS
ncbi:hypothetical protein CRG98_003273 [Punica granatum]|uniref:Uncharacterized protein n=1 Tax=Punica granatum TaxID=22663 RepID=A0A2I0L6M1_PUNGR|nr:hypothetical protein CRG98_003273 [Punica granatum]